MSLVECTLVVMTLIQQILKVYIDILKLFYYNLTNKQNVSVNDDITANLDNYLEEEWKLVVLEHQLHLDMIYFFVC